MVVQVCLANSDWSGVAKVSELEQIPSYREAIQLTSRIPLPESRPRYGGFRVIKVRVIETHLYVRTVITAYDNPDAHLDEGSINNAFGRHSCFA